MSRGGPSQVAFLTQEEQDRAAAELRAKRGMVSTQRDFETALVNRQHESTWKPGDKSKRGYKNITERLAEQAEELSRTMVGL